MSKIDWFGDKIRAKLVHASIRGVNKTMGQAVSHAKAEHPFTNRTTTAEKALRIAQPASQAHKGAVVSGMWGFANLLYGKYLELGTKLTSTRTSIKQRLKGGGGRAKNGRFLAKNAGSPPWKGGSYAPTLRPAAAATYGNLARNIKEAFRG